MNDALLSLDIDGNDYHALEAIEPLNARVILVEHNPNHSYDSSGYFGCSLKSYEELLSARGYKLVGCNLLGVNTFFVREDLVKNHFHGDCSAENHYEPESFFLNDGLMPLHAANFGPFEIK